MDSTLSLYCLLALLIALRSTYLDFKCFKFGTDFYVNPGLLIQECPYSNSLYDIIDAFADVANGLVCVCVYVVVLKHTPSQLVLLSKILHSFHIHLYTLNTM